MTTGRSDIYAHVTNRIISDLDNGVRPWHKPWNAGNTEGRITRPLRHNGVGGNDFFLRGGFISANAVVYAAQTMRTAIGESTWFYGLFAGLFGMFGIAALVLGTVGLMAS